MSTHSDIRCLCHVADKMKTTTTAVTHHCHSPRSDVANCVNQNVWPISCVQGAISQVNGVRVTMVWLLLYRFTNDEPSIFY